MRSLFDVYGTLMVSGTGDIGNQSRTQQVEAFAKAAAATGLGSSMDATAAMLRHRQLVSEEHCRLQSEGIEFPEVDIVDVWRRVFEDCLTGTEPEMAASRLSAICH